MAKQVIGTNVYWADEYAKLNANFTELYNAMGGVLTSETKTSTATITLPNDKVILCNATAGNMSINLPAAADVTGRKAFIKKTDVSANTVTIDPFGSETVNGDATTVIQFQNTVATVVSDGTGWSLI